MVQFRVRATSLNEVAGLLGNVLATFDGNVAAVDSTVRSTLSTWKGDDATELEANWQSFVTLSETVRMSLTNLQTGLIGASQGYTTTEGGVRQSMAQTTPSVQALRKHAVKFEEGVATGEARAEDMAEFFGRDYAGDGETEKFGGGAVRGPGGRYTGGGAGDTDGDGDDDSIGTGPFLSNESIEELGDATESEEAGFVHDDEGRIEQSPDAEGGAPPEAEAPEAEDGPQTDADAPQAEVPGDGESPQVEADVPEAEVSDGADLPHVEADVPEADLGLDSGFLEGDLSGEGVDADLPEFENGLLAGPDVSLDADVPSVDGGADGMPHLDAHDASIEADD
ncbi:WXG100 family type VII secretion target [Microbacterium sp. G2-8]|uniref:WXG100 family type VII secretion target n=1 Tax=Microbacterium sp. G2-8 TaxID=2842454 RepID=UPI001C89FBC6|nr:hypothetical protein [Microbacterium sp. G2-8]